MSEEIPTLKDVHQMVILADTLEEQHLYLEALEKYKEAIELLMPLNEVVMSANKKKMISSEVQILMQRSEELTVLLQKPVPELNRYSVMSLKSTVTDRCHVQ
jgi:hypothetical protein